jgi:thiosulfate/3-mercaptopyruvate sulfurtransferase
VKLKKTLKILFVFLAFSLILTGCTQTEVSVPGEQGQDIISAEEALNIAEEDDVVLVDAQKSGDYEEQHLVNAVNIARNDITSFGPYPNMLADSSKIEEVLGENGISNTSRVIIYDNNNNMDAARLMWTLHVFGHEDVQVISGGISSLIEAGAETGSGEVEVETAEFKASEKNEDLIATKEEVLDYVNNPSDDVVILDVRTAEEVNEGIIPNAVHINYTRNINEDGEYRPYQDFLRIYPDKDVTPDKKVIMYCKTSIRAAQTYAALRNAGYRDLEIYDGAWIEWSSDSSLPVGSLGGAPVQSNAQDGS